MIQIKMGDIFRKIYVDHIRYFLATADSIGFYCDCIDINTGEVELVKLPMPNNKTVVEVL